METIEAKNLYSGAKFIFEGRSFTVFSVSPDPRVFGGRICGLTKEGPGFDFAPSDRFETMP